MRAVGFSTGAETDPRKWTITLTISRQESLLRQQCLHLNYTGKQICFFGFSAFLVKINNTKWVKKCIRKQYLHSMHISAYRRPKNIGKSLNKCHKSSIDVVANDWWSFDCYIYTFLYACRVYGVLFIKEGIPCGAFWAFCMKF